MTKEIKLTAESRDVKVEKAGKTRRLGYIPAVIYGHGVKNQVLKVKEAEFNKIFPHAGQTHLINLSIDQDQPVKVLIYGLEKNNTKGKVLNVDFLKVNMKEKITVEIPLNFIGESKAVEIEGGVLNKTADRIEVECLPDDLIDSLDVDLSVLETKDDMIKMSDLKLPKGLALVSDTDETLVSIVEPTVEEEVPAEEEAVTETAEAAPAPSGGEEKTE